MAQKTSPPESRKPYFVNQFVNTVYGILLGFGFSDSMSSIVSQVNSENESSSSVGIPYSVVVLIYVIVVICVYWWDWVENVGHRVENTSREFTIDISILISLELLFVSYAHPELFVVTFLILAILNLLWVYNYRYEEFQATDPTNAGRSFTEYLQENDKARNHIVRRWYGVALYTACVIAVILAKGFGLNDWIVSRLNRLDAGDGLWEGNWITLLIVVTAGLFNRLVLYRERFDKKQKSVASP